MKKSAKTSKKLTGTIAKGLTKFTAKNAHVEGVKRNGTLKKGYKYVAGGKIVKVKIKAIPKKGLKGVRSLCVRRNEDGSNGMYQIHPGGNPCPNGGKIKKVEVSDRGSSVLNGVKKSKKPTAKQSAAQKAFAINAKKARELVASGKAKTLKSAWQILKKK